jgi:hypothetical protein
LGEAIGLLAGTKTSLLEYYAATGGKWPIPLSKVGAKVTGTYTESLVSGKPPLYVEATMKTEAEGVAACFASKKIRFIFEPDQSTWSCETNIAEDCIKFVTMTCTQNMGL